VTHDGGRTFRRYAVSALLGDWATLRGIRASGDVVTIDVGKKTATVHA
jgi:hypothetical protein